MLSKPWKHHHQWGFIKNFGKNGNIGAIILILTALAALTMAVYLRVMNHPFVSYDDGLYVANNLHVAQGITGRNIIWAFTTLDTGNWYPLTWLSHMADFQMYGMTPRGHHLTNVFIHTAAALLLLILLLRSTGALWQSSFVAALFALHPLHVESVAWVAERKDLLCAFFYFLSLFFYSKYIAKLNPAAYLFALMSFMLALMAKPMAVTLPAVMLLMDYWPFERFWHKGERLDLSQVTGRVALLVREKAPFFVFSFASSIVTIYAQHESGAVSGLKDMPLLLRIENSLVAYCTYIGKTLWPYDLAVLYPFPFSIPIWQVLVSSLIMLLLSAVAFRVSRHHPYVTFGWFWFLVTLLPVIGLIQVGSQSMADRYTYIPLTGLFVIAAWGVPVLVMRFKYRRAICASLVVTVIISSAALSQHQLGYWRDSITLYRHTLEVTTANYITHYNLGTELQTIGFFDEAMLEYQKSLRINPESVGALINMGILLQAGGNHDEAIAEYRKALRIAPHAPDAHYNLGLALAAKGELNSAILEYLEVLRINPDNKKAHTNIGAVYAATGDLEAAIRHYLEAVRIMPDDSDAHYNLGVAFASKGDLDKATDEYREALRLNPRNSDAQGNLAVALAQKEVNNRANK